MDRTRYPATTAEAERLARLVANTLPSLVLRHRAEEDMRRDPLDAARDAERQADVLRAVAEIVEDFATSHTLKCRLRADLLRSDIATALSEAIHLARFNYERVDQAARISPASAAGGPADA